MWTWPPLRIGLHDLADRAAVLQQLVPDRHVAHGDLVTQEARSSTTFNRPTSCPSSVTTPTSSPGLQVANCNADIIVGFVDQDTV